MPPPEFSAQPSLNAKYSLYATSGFCIACHTVVKDQTGNDVSMDTSWRSAIKAQAALDPYFLATVRSEVDQFPEVREIIEDKCASCHMPMAATSLHLEGVKAAILDDGLLLRRINIRQVVIFPKTFLARICGDKYLRKNKEYYWKWRNEIRQEIDATMLKRLLPVGSTLKGLRTEIYDGNTTFARQIGTYPLIVGIKERLGLDQFIDVRVVDHMLRSVVGEPII